MIEIKPEAKKTDGITNDLVEITRLKKGFMLLEISKSCWIVILPSFIR